MFSQFPLLLVSRPTPRIPLPCRLPQPSRLWTCTTERSTAHGPASVPRPPRPARRASACSWTAATAARPAPGRWGRCATRPTPATTTRDCTVTTARTCRGTKKECVHVSVTHGKQTQHRLIAQVLHPHCTDKLQSRSLITVYMISACNTCQQIIIHPIMLDVKMTALHNT